MNWLDAAIAAVLFFGLWRGAGRGLGQAGCQVGGAVGGVVAAYVWGEDVATALARRLLLPDWLARPLAWVGLAAGFVLAGHLAGRAWSRWVKGSSLETWDRWMGALLGLALAALASGALLLIWIEWPGRPFPQAVEGSFLARQLLAVLPAVYRRIDWVLAPLRSARGPGAGDGPRAGERPGMKGRARGKGTGPGLRGGPGVKGRKGTGGCVIWNWPACSPRWPRCWN